MYERYQDFIDILKVSVPIYKNDMSKGYIKEIIVRTLRMVESVSKLDVSKAAQEIADSMNIGSLYRYNWTQQNKKRGMRDFDRSIFHWEHFYPIQQQLNDLLSLEILDDGTIYNIFRRGKVCWILKDENRLLDAKFKSNRPDPIEAYRLANITLLGEREMPR
jgi:hypothetical protein